MKATGTFPTFRRAPAHIDRLAEAEGVFDLDVVIPVLNEERRIQSTLETLVSYLGQQAWKSRVIVVDNGCTDRTTEAVDRITSSVPVLVIGCSSRGKGAAVRRGVLASTAKRVGFCDADMATPVETLGAAMATLDAGCDVVVGSRRCEGAAYLTEQSFLRRMGGHAFRSLARTITPEIADTQCGFKFFDAGVAQALFSMSRADGFAFDVEIVGLAFAAGADVREIPVIWSDVAESSFRPIAHGLPTFRELRAVSGRLQEPTLSDQAKTLVRNHGLVPLPHGTLAGNRQDPAAADEPFAAEATVARTASRGGLVRSRRSSRRFAPSRETWESAASENSVRVSR